MEALLEPQTTISDDELVARYRRRIKRRTLLVRALTVAFGVALLGIWELIGGAFVSHFWISEPSLILERLWETTASGELITDIRVTMVEFVLGYIAGGAAGMLVGFGLARVELAARVLNPYIAGFYGIPKLALAPLFILWFGLGLTSKIIFVLLNVFFLVFYNTYSGFRNVPRNLTAVARVLGANEFDVTYKVMLPHAAPWVLAGLRIAVPFGISAAVVAEFIAANDGLGYRIYFNSNVLDTTGALAGILVLAVLVMILSTVFDLLERRYFLRWRPTDSNDTAGVGAVY